ncbi:acyl-CoA--6-aminopenicillanic acid acyl-transferase [Niabella terrae]
MHKKKIRKNRTWRRLGRVLAVLLLLLGLFAWYMVRVSRVDPPVISDTRALSLQRNQPDTGLYTIGDNWLRQSNSGLYEMYVSGTPFAMGVKNGKLSEELVQKQEDYFSEQIGKMIPSRFYLHFLKYFIGWFNRDLSDYVTDEYQQEIYGVSRSASEGYRNIGTKYSRILNYHSAHDIGHALQNMMLVGCTSFGTWGAASQDSNLIIGRNFDFWVGDHFARNKIVAFMAPDKGYRFMSVTWGGFIGVVSGMNEKGLTVTINAAKSDIPSGAATPVSLVAREIIQYAKNIAEAVAIARKRKMFVSESFLVGSAADNRAVIVEKTPDSLALYDPGGDSIQCTNHFQSRAFSGTEKNREQQSQTASGYRYRRLQQLLAVNGANTVAKTVAILRDYKGLDNADIGLGNEKAVNQFIAHHSIVFEPRQLKVWVSTGPWQMGAFRCYDLHKIFSMRGLQDNHEIDETALEIPADSFIYSPRFRAFERYRAYKEMAFEHRRIVPDSVVAANPALYNSYVIAGDYLFAQRRYADALPYYRQALQREIPSAAERRHITDRMQRCKEKLD